MTRPVGVEKLASRPIDAFVLVRTEVIALGLQQIRRQTRIPESVVVAQRRRHGRNPHAVQDRRGHHTPPCLL